MEDLLQIDQGLMIFGIVIMSFVVFSLAEVLFPRRTEKSNMTLRWINNIGLAFLTNAVVNGTQIVLNIVVAWWVDVNQFGLLQLWNPGWIISLITTVLVMELMVYVFHRILHKVPLLWRIHAVHHSDTEFDISLAYRNHPLAAIFLIVVRLPVIILLGAPVEIIFIYEIARIAQDLFSHSNIRLSPRIEKYLQYIIVTPDFHRIHHSSDKQYTNSNYSSTIPLFDYLFKTNSTRPFDDHEDMQIGLEYFREEKNTRLDQLLLMPFKHSVFPSNTRTNKPKEKQAVNP